jgi:hypothetical protein
MQENNAIQYKHYFIQAVTEMKTKDIDYTEPIRKQTTFRNPPTTDKNAYVSKAWLR